MQLALLRNGDRKWSIKPIVPLRSDHIELMNLAFYLIDNREPFKILTQTNFNTGVLKLF